MWTRTELASALAIKARRGELAQERLSALCREFELWVAGGVSVVPVDSVDFMAAAKQCEHMESKLRAGDALHLCVARRCQVTHLFSLDKDMLENADVLGIQKIER
jgi:predicted nucleic acid-binding protein